MKQRAKRLMALFMAGVFTLSTCMTSGPYTVLATETGTAGVTTPSEGSTTTPDNTTPSGTPEEGGTTDPEPEVPTQHTYNVKLPEKIKDVDWGNLQVTYGEEKVSVTAENTIALNNVITDSSAVGIESDNYSFADITVNEGTINVATATPKISNPEIKGEKTTLSIDEKGEYSISNIPAVWKDKVTWSVQPGAENITKDGVSLEDQEDHTKIKVIVSKEGYEGANEKPEILVAHIGEVQIGTFNFNVTKKNPELSLKANPETPAGWKTEIKLLVSGEKDFKGTVIVSDENGQTQEVAVENGKAEEINWNLSYWTKDYKFVVTYAGDKVYKSESISLAYNVDKETQEFGLTQSAEQKDITYGGSEKQIASIAGTKSSSIHPWNYSYEWENDNNGGADIRVDVDGEKLLFTPGQAGTYKVTIKRSSEDYNEQSCTLAITVKKKALTVKNVTATNRVYDGTDKVEVTATVDTSEMVEKDRPAGESLQLTTAGKVQGDGKLEGKDVADGKTVKYGDEYKDEYGQEYGDFSLSQELNSNYELVYADNEKPDVKVNITKQKLTLAVVLAKPSGENNIKETETEEKILYLECQYTGYKDLSNSKEIQVVADGFVNGESAETLTGYRAPRVIVDTTVITSASELNHVYKDALIPDEIKNETDNPYNATDNYEFDFENITQKGSLSLTPQKITDIKAILSVDNASSTKAYQRTDNKEIYYGQGESEIAWKIDNQFNSNVTETSDLNAIYNAVEVRHRIDIDIPEEGASLSYSPKENDETIYVRLKASEGNGVTQWCEMTLINDTTAPETTISLNNTLFSGYEFASLITFGLFSNKQVNAEIGEIKDREDGAGVKSWKYYKIDLREDTKFTKDEVESENFAKKIGDILKETSGYDIAVTEETKNSFDGQTIVLGADEETEDGNFVVFVVTEDNVGNQAVYGSNGVVIDRTKLKELTLNYDDEGQIATNKEGVQYFKKGAEVSITAKAKETTDKVVYSGVKKISADLYNYDASDPKADKIDMEGWITKENTILTAKTLDELRAEYSELEATTKTVKGIGKNECARYKVIAKAEDFAGNTFENVTKTFVLDNLDPKVTNTINKNKESSPDAHQTDKGIYYTNEAITIETTITERFTDDENITLTLEKLNDAGKVESTVFSGNYATLTDKDAYEKFGILSLECTEVEDPDTNNAKRTITITIPNTSEGIYSYTVNAKDYSKNTGDACTKFCIDNTAPDVKVTYTAKDENGNEKTVTEPINRENSNETAFTGDIKVVEKNFKALDDNTSDIICKYDADGVEAYLITGDIEKSGKQKITEDSVTTRSTKDGNSDTIGKLSELANDIHKKASWSGMNENDQAYHYTFTCTTEANYEFPYITITDLAGNTSEATGNAKITLDRTAPQGTVTVGDLISNSGKETSWTNRFLDSLTFGLYGKAFASASISNRDETTGGSGIGEKKYYLATNRMTKEALNQLNENRWTSYRGNITMAENRNYIVYEKVVDKAGNLAYYSSDRVIVDHQDPQPEVTITPTTPGWGKGVYSASDNPGFDVNVVDPAGSDGSCAGLAEIKYTIKNGTTGYQENGTLASYAATDAPVATYKGHVTIDPEKFYSNDVQVTVEATDHSTNGKTTETQSIKVDNKAPIVTFSFDQSDVHNGKYYNNDKTLTITVDERNFDESYQPQVTSTAGGGYSISGWSHNGEIHTATVTFSGDSDYTVTYDCFDLAGNKSNTEKLDEFTVDKTKPVIQVSYDNNSALNNNYYKEARTATITITEHNFNPGEVTVTTTAQLDGAAASAPGVSGWSGSGDTHVATVSYSADADYTFTISATDLASNVSDPYATESFTVDQTKPTVEITNIEDRSANNGEVAPVITLNDINFDSGKTVVHLTGANKGEVDTTGMYTSVASNKGQTLTFYNFKENMDDIYTLTAETTDKAGNQYSTSKIFSVNRDGSTYMYDTYTEELIKNGYTNDPKNLVVSEINVDTLTFQELTVSENGTQKTLEQNKDFEVSESGSDVSWKEYKYTINASNFENEGDYNVSIYSEDRATNVTTNTAKSKDILFAVDKTSPVISLANIEDGGRYKVESQKFTANVDDNMALDKVEYYVDDELKQTFDADEVSANGGSLELSVDSSNTFQNVSVKAYDKANNEATTASVDVLVSANTWVQFYNNKPAFYGTIGGGVAAVAAAIAAGVHFSGAAAGTAAAAGKTAAGAGIFLAGKKRKKDEE